jgi:Anti-sigma-K factor rskA
MDCARTVDLGAYLLGGMTEAEARDMRVHIDTCTWCSRELADLRPVADLLDSTELASSIIGERLEPTPDAASRLFARASSEIAAPPPSTFTAPARRRGTRRKLVAAGAAVFALGVGSTLGTQQLVAKDAPKPKGERVQFVSISLGPKGASPTTVPSDPKKGPKAWASITQTPAGTYAYLYVRDFEIGKVYKWWFIKRDGTRVPLGSFRYPGEVNGDEWLQCPGHTAFDRSELIAIGATNADGLDVVKQDLPPAPPIVAT